MKVLKIDPACMRAWVALLFDCVTKSGPPYIALIAPVSGSIVTVPTLLFSGRSSGRLSTAATVFSWICGSIVDTIVRPPVLISSSVSPAASSSERMVASRYPLVPPSTFSELGSMVSGNWSASASAGVICSSATWRVITRSHRSIAASRSLAGS